MKRVEVRDRKKPALDEIQNGASVDERNVALILGVSVQWVRKQRYLETEGGKKYRPANWQLGPLWTKVGKSVRYPVAALREWQAKHERARVA